MDLYRIIRELVQERDRLAADHRVAGEMKPSGKAVAADSLAGKRRGRKSMDHAARAGGFGAHEALLGNSAERRRNAPVENQS